MNKSRTRAFAAPGFVAATAATVVAALIAPAAPAVAASALPGADRMAPPAPPADLPEATQEEKVRAAGVLGIVAGDDLLILSDCNFTIEIWKRATGKEVKAAAAWAFGTRETEYCTAFIRTEIHEVHRRDKENEVREAEEARVAREARRAAAAVIGIVAGEDLLGADDKEFVYRIWQRATGKRVKDAAQQAWGGSAADIKAFIATGIREAHQRDQREAIDADEQASAEEKRRRAEADARRNAAAVVAVVASHAMLQMSDRDFIYELWNLAKEGTEVRAAAESALRSRDPEAWRQFIHTGIREAKDRDVAAAMKKRADEDRSRAQEIQLNAERTGRKNLAIAVRKALAGTADDIDRFLRVGQYEVGPDVTDLGVLYDHGNARTGLFAVDGVGRTKATPRRVWDSGPGQWDVRRSKPVTGDFDHDGQPDMAAFYNLDNGRTQLRVVTSFGTGTPVPKTVWDSGTGRWDWNRTGTPLAGDFDGDGKAEVAVFYDYGNRHTKLWVFRGLDGSATSPRMTWESLSGWDMRQAKSVTGDVDGDGKADIAAFYNYGNSQTKLWVFDQLAAGPATARMAWDSGPTSWDWARSGTALAGDFDGDRKSETAAFYDYGNGRTKLWVFDGLGGNAVRPRVAWETVDSWDAGRSKPMTGDFNADGKTDIAAFYNYDNNLTKLWRFDQLDGSEAQGRLVWQSNPGGWDWNRTLSAP